MNFASKCEKCQTFTFIPRQAIQELVTYSGPWLFTKWRINFIGPLLRSRSYMRFNIVLVDYFTKWVVTEPLANIVR